MVVLHMSFDPPSCFEVEGRFDLARTTPDVTRCDRRALLQPRIMYAARHGAGFSARRYRSRSPIPARTCPDKSAPQEGD